MTLNPTIRALFWGALLGAIFGAGVAMGFGGGWSLIDTRAMPLLRAERLFLLEIMFRVIGMGLVVGAIWGSICAILVRLGKRNTLILTMLILVANLLTLTIDTYGGGIPFLTLGLGIPTLAGYGLLQLYLFFNRPNLFLLLILLTGFMFAYLPWSMNGRDYENVLVTTDTYAKAQGITNYQLAVNRADSGGSESEIHQLDGTILTCQLEIYNRDIRECNVEP
jgi:hypothetical protein